MKCGRIEASQLVQKADFEGLELREMIGWKSEGFVDREIASRFVPRRAIRGALPESSLILRGRGMAGEVPRQCLDLSI